MAPIFRNIIFLQFGCIFASFYTCNDCLSISITCYHCTSTKMAIYVVLRWNRWQYGKRFEDIKSCDVIREICWFGDFVGFHRFSAASRDIYLRLIRSYKLCFSKYSDHWSSTLSDPRIFACACCFYYSSEWTIESSRLLFCSALGSFESRFLTKADDVYGK